MSNKRNELIFRPISHTFRRRGPSGPVPGPTMGTRDRHIRNQYPSVVKGLSVTCFGSSCYALINALEPQPGTIMTLLPRLVLLTLAAFLAAWAPVAPARAQSVDAGIDIPDRFEVKIGVLAFRGNERAVRRWTPTADYLSEAVPEYRFTIVPHTLDEIGRAASDGTIDFVLTNSGNYVMLESEQGISRIATLRVPATVEAGHVFGAVIITKAGRPDINDLSDLRGHSFIAVNRDGFGGFQMAWRELAAAGVDPFKDLTQLDFVGFPQDEVVYAVRDGRSDAGTVRTGTLENMAAEGKINMSDFRVLNRLTQPGFPYELSTALYPEWPFARTPHTPEDLTQKVAIALMSMPRDHHAAKKGRYGGWTVPADYSPVYDLFRDLRIGPYAELGKISLKDMLARHWQWLLFAFVLIVILAAWATHTESVVAERTQDLVDANKELERQIAERRKAEEEAQRRRNEVAHVWRFSTMGEMATNLAHELNQPLSAIANYARGAARRLAKDDTDPKPLLEAMDAISTQAERAGEIIRRVRTFLRKDDPTRRPLDVRDTVREVIDLLHVDILAHGTKIKTAFVAAPPLVDADPVQLQQVVLNLMRNGMEAMNAQDSGDRILHVSVSVPPNGGVEIAVSDQGAGIPQPDLDHIFDPFYTTKENGLGMGLPISRSIIESHGGRLTAASHLGGGTEFRVYLPATGEDATHAA